MLNSIVREVLAFKYGVIALVVIFYYMTAELIMALSLDIVFQYLALFWSLFANFFFLIPGLLALLFGVLGTPLSWPNLIVGLIDAYGGNGILFFVTGVFSFFIANIIDVGKQPKKIDPEQTSSNNDSESGIFINGIAVTPEVAKSNSKQMFKMFQRPVTTAYNPANGMIADIIECAIWKTGALDVFGWCDSPPRQNLIKILKKELERDDKKTVVLLAHSQGTIITGNAIEDLATEKKYADLMLAKLEVYTFANCAHVMSEDKVRRLENLYNRRDWVAWLGQLFPFPQLWKNDKGKPIKITGLAFEEPTSWGHLLNTHYLLPMENSTKSGIIERRKFKDSRLWEYYDGKHD